MVRIWVSRALRYYLELVNYQRVASPLERSMMCIGVSGALKHYLQLVNYQRVASPLERSMVCIEVSRALKYYLELVNYQRVASPLETSMVCIRVSRALKHYLELNYQRVAFSYRVCLQRVAFSYPPLDPPNGSLHASVITRRYQFGFLQSSWTNKRASSSERSAAAVWHRAIRNRRPQCNNPNIERIIKPRSPLKLKEAPEVGCVCGHH